MVLNIGGRGERGKVQNIFFGGGAVRGERANFSLAVN